MKKYVVKWPVILVLLIIISKISIAQTKYKITLFRAAPGELLSFIDNIKYKVDEYQGNGGDKPYIIRHSLGVQWELMDYEHIKSGGGMMQKS